MQFYCAGRKAVSSEVVSELTLYNIRHTSPVCSRLCARVCLSVSMKCNNTGCLSGLQCCCHGLLMLPLLTLPHSLLSQTYNNYSLI